MPIFELKEKAGMLNPCLFLCLHFVYCMSNLSFGYPNLSDHVNTWHRTTQSVRSIPRKATTRAQGEIYWME